VTQTPAEEVNVDEVDVEEVDVEEVDVEKAVLMRDYRLVYIQIVEEPSGVRITGRRY
jgi:hypothetical protein